MKKHTAKVLWMLLVIVLLVSPAARAGRFALVADGTSKLVAEFYVSGTTWTWVKNFADSTTPLGALAPLNAPTSVAQDQQGRIYVSDQLGTGGRVLRFDTNGVFLDMVGTNGLNGYSLPGSGIDDLVAGPDGNIYGTEAFGSATANYKLVKFNVATTNWTTLVTGGAMINPRGLDFGPDGNIYVNSRGNAKMLVFDTSGNLLRTNATYSGTVQTTPMGLRYAPGLSKFICTSGNGNSVICSCPTNGTIATNATLITGQSPSGGQGAVSVLGVLADGTNVFFATYANPGRVNLCNPASTTSVSPVDSGTTPALNQPTFMNFVTRLSIGTLQSVALNVTRTSLILGTAEQAQLLGNYSYQSGVDISADSGTAWSSSNPAAVTVSPSGRVSAVGLGSSTLTASNSGLTNTVNLTVVPLVTTLIHRYGFTNDASDSVGTANGTIYGADYAFVNGQIALQPVSQYDYNYVDFGPNTITGNDALTFEAWASFGTNYNWARLFDFGDNDGVNGTSFVALSPHSSTGNTRVAIKTLTAGETDVDAPGVLDNQTNVHIVVVFHPLAGYIKLYLNGILAAQQTNVVGQDLANVVNNYSYLGKSQFYLNPAANESVDEFRVYSGVLQATNVAFDYAAGPNRQVSNPGALQSVTLVINTNMLQQGQQTVVAYGNFANVAGVPINNFPGISFTAGDTNVLTVSSSGMVQAVGFGTTMVTATYGTQSVSYSVTVTPLPQARLLVTDGGNNRVLLYNAIGTNLTLASVFAAGTYDGLPLTQPTGLAQDSAGHVYVSDLANGARLLKFSGSGVYLGTLGTNGVDFFANTGGYLAVDPNGNVYMSTPFGTNNILEYNVTSNAWSVFVPTTDNANYTLVNPIGIAFGPAGNLYVCNRGAFNAANRSVLKFDTNGVYVPNPNTFGDFATGLTGPQGLTWDAANNRFLVTVSATAISAIDTNGVVTPLSSAVGADILSAVSVGQNLFYSDYSASGVYVLKNSSSAALVAGGIVNAHQMIQMTLPPNLSISASGTNVVVAWPYSTPAYNLKSSASLSPANWQGVTPTPVQVGNIMQVTLPAGSDTQFFRLSN